MLISTSKAQSAGTTLVRHAVTTHLEAGASEPKDEVHVRGPMKKVARALGHGVEVATTGAAVLEAFPKFIYPSIIDATAAEQAAIMGTLDKLPLHHVGEVSTISMVPSIASDKPGWVVFGNATDYGVTSRIHLSRESLKTPQMMEDTLIHEVGHTTDYAHKPYPLGPGASSHHPYGEGNHVTEYAKTNPKEDYAETYQEYHQRPENLKKTNPDKFADMEETNRPNFLERMVDRKEFRETGKYLGQLMGPNKPTRHAIDTGIALSGALHTVRGIEQWSASAWNGDGLQHAQGILSTLAGAVMLSGVAPLAGVGIQAASVALGDSVKRGELTGQEVESTIALPVRPLESLFGRKPARIQEDHRPGKVLAVAAGGAVGGTVGALAGPYLGVLGGYHLAGGLGGAVGLVAGGVLGFMGGTQLGGRVGAKLADLAA